MVNESEFSAKSYLISGAASGVGADICRELLNHGAYVYALDFNEGALKKLEKEQKWKDQTIWCLTQF